MLTIQVYELHRYDATEADGVSAEAEVIELPCLDERGAVTAARKLAQGQHGPVDVARKGPSPWNDRYVGTAMREYPFTTCRRTIFGRID